MKKILFVLLLLSTSLVFANDDLDIDRLTDEAIEMAGSKLSSREKEMLREKLKPHREQIQSLLKMDTQDQLKFIAEAHKHLKSSQGKEELNNELNQLSPEERELFQKLR